MTNSTISAVRHINHSFDPEDSDNSCLRLVRELSPEWNAAERQDVKFKRFTDGITNILIKVSHEWPGRSEADADREAVLVRAYGNETDTMIDRAKELRVHQLLAGKGLASPLLARFDNGFMYGYIPGEPCTPQDYHDAETSRVIARKLGQWHGSLPISALQESSESASTDTNPSQVIANIWSNAQKWIDLLPDNTTDLKERNEAFRSELAWLLNLLGNTPGLEGQDLVFSHTDLLCGNVILEGVDGTSQAERSVTFIDYEYATAAPAAFDVANVFAEWAGPEGELAWMPSQPQRLDFIQHYVDAFRRYSDVHTHAASVEQAVEQLYQQVDLFRGLPGFYWGIWGLIQASISDIDFDFAAYAERRHSEYCGWKAEYDGSRVRDGLETTVREQAWARK
jgi:ethanolamine kinase